MGLRTFVVTTEELAPRLGQKFLRFHRCKARVRYGFKQKENMQSLQAFECIGHEWILR